jgi:hypothetical protein
MEGAHVCKRLAASPSNDAEGITSYATSQRKDCADIFESAALVIHLTGF